MLALNIIVASVLLLLGFLLIITLLKLFFGGMLGNYRIWTDRRKLRKKEELLAKADELVSSKDFRRASQLLEEAFCLYEIPASLEAVERSQNLHMTVLGRVLSIADQNSTHIDNLALLEELVHARYAITKTLLEKHASLRTLKRQNAKEKKSLDWALTEYKTQIDDLQAKLASNKKNLQSQTVIMFKCLWSRQASDEVTYH